MTDLFDASEVKLTSSVCPKCYDRKYIVVDGDLVTCNYCVAKESSLEFTVDPGKSIEKIPELYRGVYFETTKLLEDETIPENIKKDEKFMLYLRSMEKLVYEASVGRAPTRSLFIAAPPGFGKNHAVYAAMEGALRRGKTVAEYLDAGELLELHVAKKLPAQYYSSDFVFIKMTSGNVTVSELQMAKLITERRARRGLPTIVTSRMPWKYFSELEPSIVELIREKTVEFDYSRWTYIAAPFIFYKGRR